MEVKTKDINFKYGLVGNEFFDRYFSCSFTETFVSNQQVPKPKTLVGQSRPAGVFCLHDISNARSSIRSMPPEKLVPAFSKRDIPHYPAKTCTWLNYPAAVSATFLFPDLEGLRANIHAQNSLKRSLLELFPPKSKSRNCSDPLSIRVGILVESTSCVKKKAAWRDGWVRNTFLGEGRLSAQQIQRINLLHFFLCPARQR